MKRAFLILISFGLLFFAGCPSDDSGNGQAGTYCGDGILQSPNDNGEYEECEQGVVCPGLGESCAEDCTCVSVHVEDEDDSHLGCVEGSCVIINSPGENECLFDSDCAQEAYCGDGIVQPELGEECEDDSGCEENEACGSCRCVSPPSLDCGAICGATEGAEAIGQGVASREECGNLVHAHYDSPQCYLSCTYFWHYQKDNAAGWDSCCCGMVKRFACTDCPGQNPQCPESASCAAEAPDWVRPEISP